MSDENDAKGKYCPGVVAFEEAFGLDPVRRELAQARAERDAALARVEALRAALEAARFEPKVYVRDDIISQAIRRDDEMRGDHG